MPKRTAQNPQPSWLRELVKIKPARKAMQLVGMSVTPFLVIAWLLVPNNQLEHQLKKRLPQRLQSSTGSLLIA